MTQHIDPGNLPQKRINVRDLQTDGETIELVADGEVLDVLTQNTPALEVFSFEATIKTKPWKQSGVVVSGSIRAQMALECVVTLDPIEETLDFSFERHFLPALDPVFKSETILDGELVLEPEGEDLPDILEGNSIDLWPVMVEELNLHIDPFPRKAPFNWNSEDQGGKESSDDKIKPFADLKALISKKNAQ